MSVVRRDARHRWLVVAGLAGTLAVLPAAAGALPVTATGLPAGELRGRILASAGRAYQGYAESRGSLQVPDLPALGDVARLLGGTTRIRIWYAGRQRWRAAVLDATGEQDTFQAGRASATWDYERNLVTEVSGDPPARLPRAADLLPPELGRRLLAATGAGDRIGTIGARRIAGVDAVGLRVVPTEAQTTVGRIEVWADPRTGLPVEVRVTGRGEHHPALVSRFLDLHRAPPAPAVFTVPDPPGAGRINLAALDVIAAISGYVPFPLPDRLAGRDRRPAPAAFAGVGGYGDGLSTFVVVPLPGRLGERSLRTAQEGGATAVRFATGSGMLIRASLLSVLVLHPDDGSEFSFLLAGMVTPQLLRGAAVDLLAWTGAR